MEGIFAVLGLLAGVFVLIFIVVLIAFFRLWLRALLSGAKVGLLSLVGMKLRKVNPAVIVDSRLMAVKAGMGISTNELETHYLAEAMWFAWFRRSSRPTRLIFCSTSRRPRPLTSRDAMYWRPCRRRCARR